MSKPSYVQLELLTEFLEAHKPLASGMMRTSDARRKAKQLWATIAVRLNSLEGANRNGLGWHKYWNDKKAYLKKLASGRFSSAQRTGDGTDAPPSLSELDTRMIALLGHNYVRGGVGRLFTAHGELKFPAEGDIPLEVSQRRAAEARQCHSPLPTTQDLLAATKNSGYIPPGLDNGAGSIEEDMHSLADSPLMQATLKEERIDETPPPQVQGAPSSRPNIRPGEARHPWRRHQSVIEQERKLLRDMAHQRLSVERERLSLEKERLTIERQRLTAEEGCLQDISTAMRTIGEALIALAKK